MRADSLSSSLSRSCVLVPLAVGMQLFAQVEYDEVDARFAHENLAGCDPPFGSISCTLFVLFQIMTNEVCARARTSGRMTLLAADSSK